MNAYCRAGHRTIYQTMKPTKCAVCGCDLTPSPVSIAEEAPRRPANTTPKYSWETLPNEPDTSEPEETFAQETPVSAADLGITVVTEDGAPIRRGQKVRPKFTTLGQLREGGMPVERNTIRSAPPGNKVQTAADLLREAQQ